MSILLDAITGFSNRPLRLITKLGLSIFFILVLRWLYIFLKVYIFEETPTDLLIIVNTILTSTSLVVLLLGMIGDYIWRILDETRKRPIYEIDVIEGEIFDSK